MYGFALTQEDFNNMKVSYIDELKESVDMFLYYLKEDDGCLAITSGDKVIAIMQDFDWFWSRKMLYIKDKDNKVKIRHSEDMDFSYRSDCIGIGRVNLNIV